MSKNKATEQTDGINWKLVAYTVGGCWVAFALTFLQGKKLGVFLNPLPIFIKSLAGIIILGYVGGTSGWEVETIFVYWNLLGLLLAWCLHKSNRKPMTVITIVAIAGVIHLVLSALALFPTMFFAGR